MLHFADDISVHQFFKFNFIFMKTWTFGICVQMADEEREKNPIDVKLTPLRKKEALIYLKQELKDMKDVLDALKKEVPCNIIPPVSLARCALLEKVGSIKFNVNLDTIQGETQLTDAEEKELDIEFSDGCFSEESDIIEEVNNKIVFAKWFCKLV